ncbi:hypothetical protein KEJ44_03515, partial [Candidatus Bathyarchaeota archaeon]|nr:hypothetical protein [Candidatus Bathyarchaeota archaeon]
MSVEEILSVIRSHPEAVAEALEKRPELLTSLILRMAPWDRLATKEDVKMILDFMDRRFNAVDKRFEDLISYSDKRFESIDKRFEDVNRRFEAMDRRFEDLITYSERRFESVDKRFEDMNKRFESMDKRFEDLTRYVDRRVGLVEKLLVGFNIPILVAVITIL